MGRVFHTFVDLSKQELRNPRMQNLSTPPSSPVTGQFYYDTDDNICYFWNGTAWTSMSGGGAGIPATIVDVKGDIIAATAADTVSRLAAGADDTILMADAAAGTGLKWVASATPGTETFGQSAAIGTADTFSRGDHAHGVPAHVLATHQEMLATADLTDWPRTAALSLSSQLLSNVLDPVGPQDAATKNYVDGLSQGVSWKKTVRAATTVTGTLATAYENGDAIDGVTLVTGDRILIKDQSTGGENGIYTVNASGAPTRATDVDSAAEILQAATWVQEGTVNADTAWVNSTNAPITLGTTATVWVQFTGLGDISAGTGLTKTAATLNVIAGTGMVANADDIAVLRTDANGRVAIRYSALYGDAAATVFNIDHNLNSLSVITQCVEVASGAVVEPDIVVSTVNRVILTHAAIPASNAYRVTVIG